MEISHEKFITILKEKDKYEKMKENVENVNEKLEETQDYTLKIPGLKKISG